MKTIEKTYHIKAEPDVVWAALTEPKHIDEWGGGPADMDAKKGTEFSLWGGSIWGTNTEVVKGKRLCQDWYDSDLPEPTLLTITLEPEKDGTVITLLQTQVPDDEASDIDEGWDDYYMGPLKTYVEALKNT